MQVYAAVYDNLKHVLIGRKRRSNQFWEGQLTFNGRTEVNQAGQFCLPGGRKDRGETIIQGAAREFAEETGIDIGGLPARRVRNYADGTSQYAMVMFEHHDVLGLVAQINRNLAPSAVDARRPAGAQVKCWELEDVLALGGHVVTRFLGTPVTPIGTGHRHSISWYARMAADLGWMLD
jgi:8-oxo-dGTP pyrophosphatase MutT (NUDIX family)